MYDFAVIFQWFFYIFVHDFLWFSDFVFFFVISRKEYEETINDLPLGWHSLQLHPTLFRIQEFIWTNPFGFVRIILYSHWLSLFNNPGGQNWHRMKLCVVTLVIRFDFRTYRFRVMEFFSPPFPQVHCHTWLLLSLLYHAVEQRYIWIRVCRINAD